LYEYRYIYINQNNQIKTFNIFRFIYHKFLILLDFYLKEIDKRVFKLQGIILYTKIERIFRIIEKLSQ
jgi:hypothetical protein